MVKPDGVLVYCVCSLAQEEGEGVVDAFLAANPNFTHQPIVAADVGGEAQFVTAQGNLRTLPCHWPERGGIDGFLLRARLRRKA